MAPRQNGDMASPGAADPVATSRATRMVALFAGVFFVGFGLWAFVDARSFYEQLAEFPPYNRHFVHDIGAFQIAIGTALVLAVIWSDSVAATLGGGAVGSIFHTAAHVWDRDLGGKDTDPWLFGIVALILTVATVTRVGGRRRR